MIRKGRRRPLSDIHFTGLPPGDDLWWLRWFDYDDFGGGVAATSMLRVVFSMLEGHPDVDALPTLDARLAASRTPQASARVQCGWLPLLSIGLVVRSGRIVGQLGATVQRFAFSAKTHRARIKPLTRPSIGMPASAGALGRRLTGPATLRRTPVANEPLLLDPLIYPLHGIGRGHLLSIRGDRPGDAHLVLPCPELFRVAYAPHRILALALLGGS